MRVYQGNLLRVSLLNVVRLFAQLKVRERVSIEKCVLQYKSNVLGCLTAKYTFGGKCAQRIQQETNKLIVRSAETSI